MKRTIESLRDILRGSVYVYLKDEETCRQFYEEAETEGFLFREILPTKSPLDDVIAVHEDKTLGHAGFVGHMKFHHPEASSEEFHRIDYVPASAEGTVLKDGKMAEINRREQLINNACANAYIGRCSP